MSEDDVEGGRQFRAGGDAYDRFMGRYSRQLAGPFADFAQVTRSSNVTDVADVGCGPGALTAELVGRLDRGTVLAVDPSPVFVAVCAERLPGATVRLGRAEALPVPDGSVDRVVAQLVLHLVSDAERAASEFVRVLRPGGIAAACVWDSAEGMDMLRSFWDAAMMIRPDAPEEPTVLRFGAPGELSELFTGAGLVDVEEDVLRVESKYMDFEELWHGFRTGIGPAAAFCVGLPAIQRDALRDELFERLGEPMGPFVLRAVARAVRGRRA